MTPQQYERLTELFHTALEIPLDRRAAFLDQLSDADADLARELASLLAVSEQSAAFTVPPADVAAAYLVQQSGSLSGAPSLALNTRIDRYEIRSLLGKGGMGEVYLAEDLRLHRKVALKILPLRVAANQDRMRRFEQEATAAAALNHPHIAHIYEIGESESTHFIAMEYIDGDTLRDKIHRDHTPLHKLVKYLTQVAEGLSKAHAAGIVHRDLKPDNVIITRDDYAKILDFGLAKLIEPQAAPGSGGDAAGKVGAAIPAPHSFSGMVMGTAGYMSPEQAQGKVEQIDHRSDIFSFGCILFEAVTGQKAFADESIIKSLHKVAFEAAPPIRDFNPSAPPDLQRIVRRCMAKDREERYQTIKDVALELREVRQAMTGAGDIDTVLQSAGSTETVNRQTTEPSATSQSSAEYIATEIKRHKKGVAIIFAAVFVALGYGLYKFAIQKSVISSPAIKFTRLTATGKVWAGVISPDGKQVVYTVDEAGQESLWLRQVVTSSNVQIVPPSEASYAAFSFTHDGNYLYFIKREKNGADSLYQMPVLGGVARKIVEDVSSRAALSADDQRIAFIRGSPFASENSLIVANSDGSGERVIATHKSPDSFHSGTVAWTPDGKSITCLAGDYGRKLVEVPLDGGADKLLKTPKWISLLNIEWLPDGSGLIVIAKEQVLSSPAHIWYLSYPSGEARKLTNGFDNYANLSLTAEGKTLLVTKQETTSHIWLAPDGDVSRAKPLTTGTGRQDGYPSVNWTPDGRITYISTASGSRHLWIMNADGSDQRQLADGANDDQGGGRVSPDGRYVVFISNRTDIFHVYRMDIDGNNLKQLSDGSGEVVPLFSADGRWVIYSSQGPGPGFVGSPNLGSWKVPTDGGERIPLTNDCIPLSISPDGKLFACVRRIGPGALVLWNISIVPFAGGPPLQTFTVTSEARPNSRWTPDGRAIIYNLTHGGVLSGAATRGTTLAEGGNLTGVTNLWIQSLDGGPPKQLTNFAAESFFSFDWSSDGKQLVYGRGSTTSDVVLISDFR
jgi:serine/threonine protein kinase/Tol biopolymer transport system component